MDVVDKEVLVIDLFFPSVAPCFVQGDPESDASTSESGSDSEPLESETTTYDDDTSD